MTRQRGAASGCRPRTDRSFRFERDLPPDHAEMPRVRPSLPARPRLSVSAVAASCPPPRSRRSRAAREISHSREGSLATCHAFSVPMNGASAR